MVKKNLDKTEIQYLTIGLDHRIFAEQHRVMGGTVLIKLLNFGLFAFMAAFIGGNMFWFCFREVKFHPSDELLDQFISSEIATHREEIPKTIQSPRDFRSEYQHCCEIRFGDEAYNSLMWVFGKGMRDIYLSYPLAIEGRTRKYTVIYSVDCCGGVWAKRTDY